MVVSDSDWICELHPLLELVSIPEAGLGYRVKGGAIKKGEVLLTESAFCAGKLSSLQDNHIDKRKADDAVVLQFIEQAKNMKDLPDSYQQGDLSVTALTTAHPTDATSNPLCPTWVQQCLDNNMYQCRRNPRYAALFIAISRFNHSCAPNAINDADHKLAHVRALVNIKEGEQVLLSYVPVGNNLARRTRSLDSFGFTCGCDRCVRERFCDPSCSTQCDECGMPIRSDDSFSSCDNCYAFMERHAAVAATNAALQQHAADNYSALIRRAETVLLLAPFATHPNTIQLHRGLVRFLQKSNDSTNDVILEQLRETKRLNEAHAGANHKDINFLRCFARLVKRCRRVQKGRGCDYKDDDGILLMQQKHVEARWANLCLLHFGERTAPDTFMADTEDNDVIVQYVPIGCDGEQLALLDSEIHLSEHTIGDAGCAVLCTALSNVSVKVIDLDSNGITCIGGTALGKALAGGAAPLLTHLDLMCNSIGSAGACALAAALPRCELLTYLDLTGNGIGDEGCIALGAAFSAGCTRLVHLNLSANGIDDRGCAALSSLFCGNSNANNGNSGKVLGHLDLSENVIESCSSMFGSSDEEEEGNGNMVASSLQYLDVSWNCIANFEPLQTVFTRTRCCTALASLRIEGNALCDRECNLFCSTLKASGATPMLECEEDESESAEFACEEDDGSELRLQQCLRSLADGEAINSRVCALDIWQNNGGGATKICTATNTSAEDSCVSSNNHLQDLLERDGFFVVPQLFPQWYSGGGGNEYSMDALASTIDRLDLAGWPPVFCFMCDAVWDLISTRLWDEMRALLGDDCVLEPSFFAWSLKPPTSSKTDGQIGQSFGLPHRDYPASEALFDDGKTPKLLNVWIPVNEATLQNGCIHIVPREFDANFAHPENQAHMRSATTVRGTGVCKLRFALNGARALPAQAGSLLAWCGNTIHWGSSCSQYSASPPRKSIAMTFRRRSVTQLEGAGEPITQESARAMSPNMRLALISRSLLLYNQWHMLKGTAVPSVIYDVTSDR